MKQKHVDCLKRLIDRTGCYHDILNFLQTERLISSTQLAELSLAVDKPKYMCEILFQASRDEKLQLLTFDWIILPEERIRLRMITDMQTQEFSYRF